MVYSRRDFIKTGLLTGCSLCGRFESNPQVLADSSPQHKRPLFATGEYKRIDKILIYTLILGTASALLFGLPAYFFGGTLLKIFSTDDAVIKIGILRLGIICTTQFLSNWMGTPGNVCRAMGHSLFPMINTITCVCVFRVIWIFTVFRADRSLTTLYLSYPITWLLAAIVGIVYYLYVRKKTFVKE